MVSCACGESWRVEVCNIKTGVVIHVLHPLSFDFQTNLNKVGQGTMTLATEEVLARNIWPGLVSVYILRTSGGSATPENPVVEFAGIVESFDASDSNTTQVGLKSIEYYLHRRTINDTLQFLSSSWTYPQVGRALVDYASTDGIPLNAQAAPSTVNNETKTYNFWDRKNIGVAIEQLTEIIDGPDWELTHTKSLAGAWSTTMIFRDSVGIVRERPIKSNVEAISYSLQVDSQNLATHVTALGAGSEAEQTVFSAIDGSGIYPRYDSVPSWPDVTILNTLKAHAEGYLEDHQEPIATPNITIKGFDPDPSQINNGDTIPLNINFGAVTYNGQGRVISTSWAVGPDEPASRTYELVPTTRASESVLEQSPTDTCEEC